MSFSSLFSGHPEGNFTPVSGGSRSLGIVLVGGVPRLATAFLGPPQVTLETFPYNAIVLFFARIGARLSSALCSGSLSGGFSIGICNFQCRCIFCGKHWNMEMLKFTDLMFTMILYNAVLFPQHFGLQRPKSIVNSSVLLK